MSLDGNCGKSDKTSLNFCMMLPVGVVLCMLSPCWVFPPLAAIMVFRRRGMLATRRCRHSTGISSNLSCRAWGAHQHSGARNQGLPMQVKCGIIIVVVVIMPEMLLGKMH